MSTKLTKIINHWVPKNSKVIDFGCGEGSLLSELIETKDVLGYGVEINDLKIAECIQKGVPVWYETENIHLCTIRDFENLCSNENIYIKDRIYLNKNGRQGNLASLSPNFLAVEGVYLLEK